MIAFGVHVQNQERYEKFALAALGNLAAGNPIAESTDHTSTAASYNEILDAFSGQDDLEALVLLREDCEIRDPELLAKLQVAFSDPSVAVVGVVGARSVPSISWRDGEVVGRLAATSGAIDVGGEGFVDSVDDGLVALSPWAVENLRFDQRLFPDGYGQVADLCFQARKEGRSVKVIDADVFHHTLGGPALVEKFRWAEDEFRRKWFPEGHMFAPSDAAQGMRIEVGGGTNCYVGWGNVDPVHGDGEWRRGAQEVPWPARDDCAETMWASHVMEHVPAGGERIDVMNEAWRVLRPGGTFEMRSPCFPHWSAIADPTHVSFWMSESILYFTGEVGANADYGIKFWDRVSVDVHDGWELRAVLRKPL